MLCRVMKFGCVFGEIYVCVCVWRLYKTEAGNKITRRNINNLRYEHDTSLMTESKEEQKSS